MTALPPFQAVLDEHGSDVYRYLVASVGPVDADDCFQEACVAALRAYPELAHGDHLRAWLFRIAERKAIDHHRARARRALPSDALPEQPVTDEPAPTARASSSTRSAGCPTSSAPRSSCAACWAPRTASWPGRWTARSRPRGAACTKD